MSSNEVIFHSVAACCNNGGIGYKGRLPWRLPKELKHFLKLTSGSPPEGKQNAVVMGRKTWDSLPKSVRPLKNRYNFVLSSTLDPSSTDAHAVAASLDDLVALLKSDKWKNKINEVFNVGGSEVYKSIQSSQYCGNVYLTRIMADFECDTFFPSLQDFELVTAEMGADVGPEVEESDGTRWKVEVYRKRKGNP